MTESDEEFPTPLNNCPIGIVLTSFSFRDNSLRSRRCCGGHRSLGVAELYAGTFNRTLVQSWLEEVSSSIESSSCSDLSKQALQNKIKNVSFTPGAAHFLFKRKWGAHPAVEGGIPRAKPANPFLGLGKNEKICSRPMVLGRERAFASWCHPNSRQAYLSPLASCYGEGAVGVSAPAPPLSFV